MESVKSISKAIKDIEKMHLADVFIESLSKNNLDNNFLSIAFFQSKYHLDKMINITEKTVINEQTNDLPNEITISKYETTLLNLKVIRSNMIRMDLRIKQLTEDLESMQSKFNFFKQNYKK